MGFNKGYSNNITMANFSKNQENLIIYGLAAFVGYYIWKAYKKPNVASTPTVLNANTAITPAQQVSTPAQFADLTSALQSAAQSTVMQTTSAQSAPSNLYTVKYIAGVISNAHTI